MTDQFSVNEPADVTAAIDNVSDTMEFFLSAASVHSVYGEPVQHGDQLIIPAAEILSIAGFGSGYGYGSSKGAGATEGGALSEGGSTQSDTGGGGGGGGGGRVFSRPVAVIVATPDRVRVKPVVDVTKIVLAWITALGFILATFFRMRSGRIS